MSKEFEVNGVQYMTVEVPEEKPHYKLISNTLLFGAKAFGNKVPQQISMLPIPAGTWEIVGLVRELTKLNTFSHCEEETEDPVNGCLCHGDGLGDCRAVINNRVMEGFNKIVEKHNLNDNSLIIKKI